MEAGLKFMTNPFSGMLIAVIRKPKCLDVWHFNLEDIYIREGHLDGGVNQSDLIYQPSTIHRRPISEKISVFGFDLLCAVGMIPELEFRAVLVVGIVPVRVVGITPDLVVEIIPDLVVEMVPARHVAETARTNVIVLEIDASFFIVLLLVTQNIRGTKSAWRLCLVSWSFRPTITNNRFCIWTLQKSCHVSEFHDIVSKLWGMLGLSECRIWRRQSYAAPV